MTKTRDDLGNNLAGDGVFVTSSPMAMGIGWACAPKHLSREEVQDALLASGQHYIPGQTPWTVVPNDVEDERWKSPGRCDECRDTRHHWMLLGGVTGALFASSLESKGHLNIESMKDLKLASFEPEESE